jgi:hypothetical protein
MLLVWAARRRVVAPGVACLGPLRCVLDRRLRDLDGHQPLWSLNHFGFGFVSGRGFIGDGHSQRLPEGRRDETDPAEYAS